MILGDKRAALVRNLLSHSRKTSVSIPIEVSTIQWSHEEEVFEPDKCPVCGEMTNRLILRMINGDNNLVMLKCSCGSVFYSDAKAPDYEVIEGREVFLMRVDQAEGVDSIIRSLLISPDIEDYSVIDLGCGIGFAVDYSTASGRQAWGFDPSPSSRLSAETLGINVSGLPSEREIDEFPKPNVVFASEVIEHVPDPREFIRQVRRMTRDEGFAVLTTPSAEYVKEGNSQPTIFSILAPSQHLFLLSAASLETLMRDAGYEWVHCWIVEERLFCVAGPRPIRLETTFSDEKYTNYLTTRLYDSPWIDENLRWRCFGYRLYKNLIHKGAYEESIPLWDGMLTTYSALGLTLDKPAELVRQYVEGAMAQNGQISAEEFPFNAVMLLFLRGTFLLAYKHDKIAARPYFDAAAELSQLYATFFRELPFPMYDREIASVPTWTAEIFRQHWT